MTFNRLPRRDVLPGAQRSDEAVQPTAVMVISVISIGPTESAIDVYIGGGNSLASLGFGQGGRRAGSRAPQAGSSFRPAGQVTQTRSAGSAASPVLFLVLFCFGADGSECRADIDHQSFNGGDAASTRLKGVGQDAEQGLAVGRRIGSLAHQGADIGDRHINATQKADGFQNGDGVLIVASDAA